MLLATPERCARGRSALSVASILPPACRCQTAIVAGGREGGKEGRREGGRGDKRGGIPGEKRSGVFMERAESLAGEPMDGRGTPRRSLRALRVARVYDKLVAVRTRRRRRRKRKKEEVYVK